MMDKSMMKSTMKYEWKTYQSGFSFALLACGTVFMVFSLMIPVMSPEVYGPAVYAIPAEAWAFFVIFASTMSLWGIYKNGRSRWSPLWRVAGYLVHLTVFLALAIMSSFAAFGSHMAIYAVFFFSPHMAFFIWVNLDDVRNVFWR